MVPPGNVMIWNNVELHNVYEIFESPDGCGSAMTRIPNDLRLTLNDGAKNAALHGAGCEVRFNLRGSQAKLILRSETRSTVPLEIYQGNFHVSSHIIDDTPTEISVAAPANIEMLKRTTRERGLPFDAGLTRMILPYIPPVRLIDFEGDASPPEPDQTPGTTQLSYGSSITHGATAIRSTGTYASRTSQFLGFDLINLGFGGGAHCESQLADYITGRDDWDIATLEMGINMVRADRFTVEVFEERVRYFVGKLAKKHRDKWIFCMDLFTFAEDLFGGNDKQEKFREVVKTTVEDIDQPKLIYLNGRDLLQNVPGLTFDLVHPSPFGMEEIARNLSAEIMKAMGSS
jgi:hypothetical protein